MNADTIRKICIAASETYLRYLEQIGGGVIEIRVVARSRVGGDSRLYKLTLGGKLFDPDNVVLKDTLHQRSYDCNSFEVVEYDADTNALLIKFKTTEVNLEQTPAENLFVISDLRFLVRNVRQWFIQWGLRLQLPTAGLATGQAGPPMFLSSFSFPTDDQQHALSTALASPFTYVWGPPGTGKTRYVLAAAILQHMRAGKRVGVFAPTNNALEQVMLAVLEAAEHEGGFNRERFLRIGSPSRKFAERFPEVCEVKGLEKRIGELEKQIEILARLLHHRRGRMVLNSADQFCTELKGLKQDLDNLDQIKLSNDRRRQELLAIDRQQSAMLQRIKRSIFGLDPQQTVHRQELEAKSNQANEEIRRFSEQIELRLARARQPQTPSDKLNEIIRHLDFLNIETVRGEIDHLTAEVQEWLDKTRALAEEYEGVSDQELHVRFEGHEAKLKELKAATLEQRLQAAQVLGMTLDALIGRFRDADLKLTHIFLDEAGYAPLVKALALFRWNVPVTFLGDHKQLPPVCEMNEREIALSENRRVVVWANSAMFADAFFADSAEENFLERCLQSNDPPFINCTKVDLLVTHRFGPNLAALLGELVYAPLRLVSAKPDDDLRIEFVDAPLRSEPAQKRENPAEAEATKQLVRCRPEFSRTEETAHVVITPYKNQVSFLNNTLPELRREGRILTIHKAQGREWDTVVLSAVDGRYNSPWFTDTTNDASSALLVLNTAVSRARKELIIVADVEFWRQRPNRERQLLSRLLQEADLFQEARTGEIFPKP